MQARLDDLEIRLTHQELAIEQLSNSHLELQRRLERMSLQIDYLKDQLNEVGSTTTPAGEEPPPHY